MDTSPQKIELTPDLLEYARAVALKEAPKHCGPGVSFDDAAQQAVLQLIRKPPKYDPTRGADVKTLIYTIVQRAVIKFATREKKTLNQYPEQANDRSPLEPTDDQSQFHRRMTGAGPTEHEARRALVEDMLRFIDNEESRAMCWLLLQCNGNYSEVARRLKLSEGTVRYRLKMLAPKLRAAGFKPPWEGDDT
ncbi:MAG: sigma-70 family RNA polymerase sigma factor [Phycisphaeraceae bacterium]|nr:sigma-70 family RNA polymerase sigma factor [Phycisphaeraceae bacterium]